ncbi:hypothetical protein UFOVP669_13 [uncultured Caudovirales phage]|uniref:Uncharacterized protein n=1 Tax=uncultured Caudovirales phage TaxID=2100421 RepID=A0A6J5M3R9_9CAUD|nr:hypothetical protein UFOVP400_4 [uncultured Caudovirales phage]CAB4155517.1 hypothetical protein UFOVP669_13 [uncultured Caudovirales phage]CAB4213343.1 hypothetical protein UFOVP1449_2 [uncultured Caudovirales phage]
MAKLPIYEQQTSMGQVRASPQAFGSGVAEAAGQLASTGVDIATTIKRRQDVIERVGLMNEFDQWSQQALTALNDTDDISRQETVTKYTQAVREKANEIVKRHGGTMNSRAELQAQIENQAGQYVKSAMGAQVKAQQTMIGNMVDQKANELAIRAAFAPDKMLDVFTELDRDIDSLSDAIAPTVAAQYKEAGRSRIAQGAIQRMLVEGRWTTAKSMLENPEVARYLNPDSARKFTIDVAVEEGKAGAEVARQERNVREWTQRLKRDLTPDEVVKIRSLPERKEMTVADQITEYELVTGRPAPQTVIDQFYKLDGGGMGGGAGGIFGNSLQGRALGFVTENAVAYANGMLAPDQARIYEASLAEAYKPVLRQNPVTGAQEEIRPTIPNFVQQAAEQGSRFYGGTQMPGRGAGGTPTPTTAPSGGMGQPAGQQPASQPSGAERTIWQRRETVTGPVSAAVDITGRIPGTGDVLRGGGQTTTDRQYVEASGRELIRALSQSGRYMATEMAAIEKEVDLSGKVFDNPTAYAQRLIGIDEALERRIKDETKIIQNPRTPLEQRKSAESVINVIQNFRQTLGVPPLVKSSQDAWKLPPGTEFRTPSGQTLRVPAQKPPGME